MMTHKNLAPLTCVFVPLLTLAIGCKAPQGSGNIF